jgi:uncharacterized membrane protein (UPF0127 family)
MTRKPPVTKIVLSSLVLVAAGGVLVLAIACAADSSVQSSSKPATSQAATTPATAASKPVVESEPYKVAFDKITMNIKGKPFSIELALSEEQEKRGLMYRDSLPADAGMLFVMPGEDTWSFWMHQTRIPLDIIYLDKTGKVLEIHARAPFDETGRGPAEKALFIIELNVGMAEKIGLKRGDVVEIPKKYLPQ